MVGAYGKQQFHSELGHKNKAVVSLRLDMLFQASFNFVITFGGPLSLQRHDTQGRILDVTLARGTTRLVHIN
jgi:hypothetical protein